MEKVEAAIFSVLTAAYELIADKKGALLVHNGFLVPQNNYYIAGFCEDDNDIHQGGGTYPRQVENGTPNVLLLPVTHLDNVQRIAFLPVKEVNSRKVRRSGCAYVMLFAVHIDFEAWVSDRSFSFSYDIVNGVKHAASIVRQEHLFTYAEMSEQIQHAQRKSVKNAFELANRFALKKKGDDDDAEV